MNTVDKLLSDAGLTARLANTSLTSRVLVIGPAEARALLVANKDNRKIRPGRVDYYAATMKQGGWRLTHQGLAFGSNGQGLDLQHRLNAVIASGVEIEILVTEGLSAEAFEAIDQHERRSAADALRLDKNLTECARFLIACNRRTLASNPTILEVGEASGAIRFLHDQVTAACNTKRAVFSSVAVRTAAMILIGERPAKAAQVLANYRNFTLLRTEDWHPVMHAFNRQCNQGSIGTNTAPARMDLLTRATIALDPAKAHLTKIQVNESAIAECRVRAARLISDEAQEDEPALNPRRSAKSHSPANLSAG